MVGQPAVLSRAETVHPLQGQSELHKAAARGDAGAVRKLLGSGANSDERDSDGCSPLHWAADRGHLEV